MIKSIFKSFNASNVKENQTGPLFEIWFQKKLSCTLKISDSSPLRFISIYTLLNHWRDW